MIFIRILMLNKVRHRDKPPILDKGIGNHLANCFWQNGFKWLQKYQNIRLFSYTADAMPKKIRIFALVVNR